MRSSKVESLIFAQCVTLLRRPCIPAPPKKAYFSRKVQSSDICHFVVQRKFTPLLGKAAAIIYPQDRNKISPQSIRICLSDYSVLFTSMKTSCKVLNCKISKLKIYLGKRFLFVYRSVRNQVNTIIWQKHKPFDIKVGSV